MLAKTYGSAVYGVDAHLITIEVSVGQGTRFFMVGLPDSAVKESEQRVDWLCHAPYQNRGEPGSGRYS